MAVAVSSPARVKVDGKFFRLGESKFHVRGVAYGPFAPNAAGQPFASPEQTAQDFAQIRELGANLVRIYHAPGRWFLDLAAAQGLKVLVDIPWSKHLGFLDSPRCREEALQAVRHAVSQCAGHPAVFAFSVANEIPADVVRWSGAAAVAEFIDTLIGEAKRVDPECLCTFTNFPPTAFLRPQCVDFVCFNVYLHTRPAFRNYLARLQIQEAAGKPLVLGETGIDSLREGEERKCELLDWQLEECFRAGLAGAVVFSYTDEWWRDGRQVEGWEMGLTTRERIPKPSFAVVQRQFRQAPYFPLPRTPKVSVVVASYNGARTLKACLESLEALNYPDYEVILVDDGSTDTTRQLAFLHQNVRYLRHEQNLGLSVARNTGAATATGEIVAYTDADCRVDEDWLYYMVSGLLSADFVAMGGPNLLPPEDSPTANAVMVSPGGPAHVMLTDRQAEHVPGCNMAFFKWVLEELGGFDPIFRQAGDDVDVCWRVQQAGYKIGFAPAAFVWHYRRSTVGDYLKQQRGYGEAEALLVRKHPEYFNSLGGSLWRGRIYTGAQHGVLLRRSIIYRGLFGSAGYQTLYAAEPSTALLLCTSLEYHVLVTLPLFVVSLSFHPLLPLAITSFAVSLAVCATAAGQANLPRTKLRAWSRPLVALLFFLQPIVRGWARYQGRLVPRPAPLAAQQTLESIALRESPRTLEEIDYWSGEPINRFAFVADVLRRLNQQGWPNKSDAGWSDHDVEIFGSRWSSLQLTTLVEDHGPARHRLRCRLRARWSLHAKVAYWTLCGLELLVLGLIGRLTPWLYLLLLTLPLLAWVLHREQRSLQSLTIIFLDEIAKDCRLAKAGAGAAAARPEPAKAGTPKRAPETAERPVQSA